jgi:hypothetical protein
MNRGRLEEVLAVGMFKKNILVDRPWPRDGRTPFADIERPSALLFVKKRLEEELVKLDGEPLWRSLGHGMNLDAQKKVINDLLLKLQSRMAEMPAMSQADAAEEYRKFEYADAAYKAMHLWNDVKQHVLATPLPF